MLKDQMSVVYPVDPIEQRPKSIWLERSLAVILALLSSPFLVSLPMCIDALFKNDISTFFIGAFGLAIPIVCNSLAYSLWHGRGVPLWILRLTFILPIGFLVLCFKIWFDGALNDDDAIALFLLFSIVQFWINTFKTLWKPNSKR